MITFLFTTLPTNDLGLLTRSLPIAHHGLPCIKKLEELCVGDLTLVVGTPETDPLPSGSSVTYIGPILWQKQGAELPDWIRGRNRERPLIWVYSGNPRYASGGRRIWWPKAQRLNHPPRCGALLSPPILGPIAQGTTGKSIKLACCGVR